MNRPPDHHGFNRLRAARKIAPLFSWPHLRELPWVVRIPVVIAGLFILACVLIFALLPLIALVAGLLS